MKLKTGTSQQNLRLRGIWDHISLSRLLLV